MKLPNKFSITVYSAEQLDLLKETLTDIRWLLREPSGRYCYPTCIRICNNTCADFGLETIDFDMNEILENDN